RDLSAFDPADPGAGFSLITSGDLAGGNIGDHSLSLLSLGGTVHGVHAWLGASFYPALNGDGTSGPTLSGVGNRWAGATTEAHGDGQTGAVMFYLRQTDAAGNPVSTSPLQHESIFRYDFA